MYRAYLQRGSAGIRVNFYVCDSEKRAHTEAQAGVQDVNLSFTASPLTAGTQNSSLLGRTFRKKSKTPKQNARSPPPYTCI